LSSKENTPTAELSPARLKQDGAVAAATPELDSARKPFVEPTVSVPLDVLEATAFFQGSAAIDIVGGA